MDLAASPYALLHSLPRHVYSLRSRTLLVNIHEISKSTPLEMRATLFGAFGAALAIASVVGPLMGMSTQRHLIWYHTNFRDT